MVYSHPLPQLPLLLNVAISPDKREQVETYHVGNTQNIQMALAYIRTGIARMGENATYRQTGMGNNLVRFNGTTYSQNGTLNWVGYFRSGDYGVDGVIIGTSGGGDVATLNQIANSIR